MFDFILIKLSVYKLFALLGRKALSLTHSLFIKFEIHFSFHFLTISDVCLLIVCHVVKMIKGRYIHNSTILSVHHLCLLL